MRRKFRFWLLVGLILSTSTCVFAQANVALIKVLKGKIKLDGRTYSSGCLAADGQTLELPAGTRVSIKLLQSSKQKEMSGPKIYKIESAQLANDSGMVKQGDVQVAESLGSTSNTAGMVTRTLKSLRPTIVTTPNNGYKIALFPGKYQFTLPNETEYRLIVKDSETGAVLVYQGLLGTVTDVPLPAAQFQRDRSYDIQLDSVKSNSPTHYKTRASVLSEERRANLDETKTMLRDLYTRTNDLSNLLSLADVLIAHNQNQEAYELILEINRIADDKKLNKELSVLIREMNYHVNMPLDTQSSQLK